jgi:CPA2 family monovalent cation:H+ antiporter-2
VSNAGIGGFVVASGNINITAYSDALVLLGTAGVLIPIFRRWGVNPVLGYLAAGVILGPLGLGSFINHWHAIYWFTIVDASNVSGIAELGVVFLLFVIGLELSLDRLSSMRTLVGGLGTMQVLISAIIITAEAIMIGQSLQVAVLLGTSLSLSSTAIVLEILSKQNRLSTSPGRATFAVLLTQDIAAIPILIFVSIGASNQSSSVGTELLNAILRALLAIAIIVSFGRFLMRPLFRSVAGAHSTELFIAVVLFVIVAAGVVAYEAGLTMAMGAFIAGLLLAETEFRKAIQTSINPFKGLLLGVFFFTVGMRIDIRELLREPALILLGVLGLITTKSIILVVLAKVFKLTWPTAIETGLLLGPSGEFAFVILGMATDLNLISGRVSGLSLAIVSLSMAATPGLSHLADRIRKGFAMKRPLDPDLAAKPVADSETAIVVGCGRVGKVVCALLRQEGVRYLATDLDPHAVLAERSKGLEVYFGDASDPEFLKSCGLAEAAGVIITINTREAIDDIVAHIRSMRRDVPIISRAHDAEHARHLYAIGATEAVPETIEASLQLSEAALRGLGVASDSAVIAVQKMRLEIRHELFAPTQGRVNH